MAGSSTITVVSGASALSIRGRRIGVAEAQQREPGAELVVEGTAVGEEDAWQARARRRGRLVDDRIAFDAVVAIAELQAPAFVFGVAKGCDGTAKGVGIGDGLIELGDLEPHAGVALRAQPVAQADRPALALVGLEQAFRRPALERGRELPAEIDGIADAGVHAVATGRDVLVRRIARQEDAAALVALGQQEMREPGIGHQDFPREGAARPGIEHCLRVGVAVGGHARLQGPGVLVVLRDQRALVGLVVPGDAEGLQDIARVGLEMNHVSMGNGRLAVQPDAELLAHDRGAAVAAGQEVAAHGLGRAGFHHSATCR